MKLKIEIRIDNAAFQESENGDEAGAILRNLGERLQGSEWHVGDSCKLLDSNGNTVGFAKVTR